MKYTNTLGAEYRSQKDTLLPKYISLDDVSSWSTCLKLKYKWKMQKLALRFADVNFYFILSLC